MNERRRSGSLFCLLLDYLEFQLLQQKLGPVICGCEFPLFYWELVGFSRNYARYVKSHSEEINVSSEEARQSQESVLHVLE